MTPLAAAAAAFNADPLPVLFLDTCVLLDVVRAPARERGPDTVRAGRDLSADSGPPAPRVYLVITDVIEAEWKANIERAKVDCRNAVRAFLNVNNLIPPAGALTGFTPATLPSGPTPAADVNDYLTNDLEQLSRDLLGRATCLARDAGCLGRAHDRQISDPPTRPAKWKSSVAAGAKDCAILEHALALSHGLGPGYPKPRYFVSSNTDDFAEGLPSRFVGTSAATSPGPTWSALHH